MRKDEIQHDVGIYEHAERHGSGFLHASLVEPSANLLIRRCFAAGSRNARKIIHAQPVRGSLFMYSELANERPHE